MTGDRAEACDRALDALLEQDDDARERLSAEAPLPGASGCSVAEALALFEDQVTSRALDRAARELKARGTGFYTIHSAGHEANALLAAQLRVTDPALLHYRSGAFVLTRARRAALPDVDAVRDTLWSLRAAAEDPLCAGRHKVWGSRPLWIVPQTSTIASHLPKAAGLAFALGRQRRLGLVGELPDDTIVCCSFGDASTNHATALAGVQAARYAHRRGQACPVLFVCEDNGIGISVDTPARWIADSFGHLPQLAFFDARGSFKEVWETVRAAIASCRGRRAPVFLRLETVRLWGHAGSDVEAVYRSAEAIAHDESRDPLLASARDLVACGAATWSELRRRVARARTRVREAVAATEGATHLARREQVVAPLAPWDDAQVRRAVARPDADARQRAFAGRLPERERNPVRRTLAAHINAALRDELAARPEALLFGEDVARKGGVYSVTAGLHERFGPARVFDTQLDETSILGLAQGAGLIGQLPIAEIQYLAYLHNALDQLRGEAASLGFFSNGAFRTPMVVRIASFAYQKGFGGHFHNDCSIAALRDIPGLMLAAPARGDDAARMLRAATAAARACGRIVAFCEPIALYHEKDLYEPGDGAWLCDYPEPGTDAGAPLLPGDVGGYGAPSDGADLLLVSYANGLRMSLRVARRLEAAGARVQVVDLRWLAPLAHAAVRERAEAIGRVLIVDECRASGGVADALVADLVESGYRGALRSVRSADSYVPLGPAAATVLLGEDEIEAAARALLSGTSAPAGSP